MGAGESSTSISSVEPVEGRRQVLEGEFRQLRHLEPQVRDVDHARLLTFDADEALIEQDCRQVIEPQTDAQREYAK